MKTQRLITIIIMCLYLYACYSLTVGEQIIGRWHLQYTEQYLINGKQQRTTGGDKILVFHKNGYVDIYYDQQIRESYPYTFANKRFPDGSYSELMLFLDDVAANYILTDDSLSISWQSTEGGNEVYSKE